MTCSQKSITILHGFNVVCIPCLQESTLGDRSPQAAGQAMAVTCPGVAARALSGFWRQGSEKETQLQQSGLDPAHQDDRISL